MEHYIFYCKLSLLAVLSLITACCMLSRRWYVNLVAFLACLPLGRDLSGPPVLPRIHAVSGGRLVHNPLPFPDMGPVQNPGKGERG